MVLSSGICKDVKIVRYPNDAISRMYSLSNALPKYTEKPSTSNTPLYYLISTDYNAIKKGLQFEV